MLTLRRKKASKCREPDQSPLSSPILIHLHRISPRNSSADVSVSSRVQSPAVTGIARPESQKEPEPEVELEIPTTPPPIEETLAARRAKRLAILAKYSNRLTPDPSNHGTPLSGTSSAVPPPPSIVPVSDNLSQLNREEPPTPLSATPPVFDRKFQWSSLFSRILLISPLVRRESVSASPEPNGFTLAKEGDEQVQDTTRTQNEGGEQVSAADYDPNQDRREDEVKRVHDVDDDAAGDVEMVVEEDEDDLDDMFAVVTTEKKKAKKIRRVLVREPLRPTIPSLTFPQKPSAPALVTTTLDSAADPEGYYSVILGEQLDGGRYQVFSSLGKGMFANVVRARVISGEPTDVGREVAIKIVRCQESMWVCFSPSISFPLILLLRYKAGLKEVQMLYKLKLADPDDKKHVVRLERTFEHRGHLCLVFESLRYGFITPRTLEKTPMINCLV